MAETALHTFFSGALRVVLEYQVVGMKELLLPGGGVLSVEDRRPVAIRVEADRRIGEDINVKIANALFVGGRGLSGINRRAFVVAEVLAYDGIVSTSVEA